MFVNKLLRLKQANLPAFSIALLISQLALAGDLGVTSVPFAGPGTGLISNYNPTSSGAAMIQWHATCFGTNVRSVANALSPYSNLVLHFTMNQTTSSSTATNDVSIECPGYITAPPGTWSGGSLTSPCTVSSTNPAITATAVSSRNGQDVMVKLTIPAANEILPDGSYPVEKAAPTISNIKFEQIVPPGAPAVGGQYPPKTGALTAKTSYSQTPVGATTTVRIVSAFPGVGGNVKKAIGFCGSYYSPLMLFFSPKRPGFRGVSKFPLVPGKSIYWVEPGAPGYFLALDQKGDRSITKADQLFGENSENGNGFEALAAYDTENRKIIDSKTPVWKKLLLWNDRNGDGIAQREEVFSMEELGVERIELSYNNKNAFHFGERAASLGNSHFYFTKKGSKKLQEGVVSDIWFTVYPEHEKTRPAQ